MTSNIPRSRLGRAIKAGIPIALLIAGGELLDGRLTIERDHGRLTLTASTEARPRQASPQAPKRTPKRVMDAEDAQQAESPVSCRYTALLDPVVQLLQSVRGAIDMSLDVMAGPSVPHAATMAFFR